MSQRQERMDAKRRKAAVACATKLDAACAAVNELIHICNDIGDGSQARGIDDSRIILVGKMAEYANWLRSVYER